MWLCTCSMFSVMVFSWYCGWIQFGHVQSFTVCAAYQRNKTLCVLLSSHHHGDQRALFEVQSPIICAESASNQFSLLLFVSCSTHLFLSFLYLVLYWCGFIIIVALICLSPTSPLLSFCCNCLFLILCLSACWKLVWCQALRSSAHFIFTLSVDLFIFMSQ